VSSIHFSHTNSEYISCSYKKQKRNHQKISNLENTSLRKKVQRQILVHKLFIFLIKSSVFFTWIIPFSLASHAYSSECSKIVQYSGDTGSHNKGRKLGFDSNGKT